MAKKNNNQVSAVRQAKHGWIWTLAFTVISILWIAPILVVLLNSFKRKAFIFRHPFTLGTEPLSAGWDKFIHGVERAFCGWLNYSNGIRKTNFWNSFGISLFITVGSVALIIICCSMCAWYITRVHTKVTKTIYVLCLFSMIVPFQMVMFTLSKFANLLHLSNPLGIIVVYLGFGAGLAVFMFTGFVKGISLEIEEAAMIDGCTPLQTFFKVVFPILKPTTVTVAILEAMWVWNDRNPVSETESWTDRLGCHDGSTCSCNSANYYLLYCVPEIYNRRSSCRCCQGLENRPFVCIYEVKE